MRYRPTNGSLRHRRGDRTARPAPRSRRGWARLAIGAAVLACVATPAPADEAPAEVRLDVDETRLDNGMTLLLVDRPDAPDFAAGWVVAGGSADDPPGRRGLAHVLEHMMFKGTRIIGSRDYAAESAAARQASELSDELERLRERGRGGSRRALELERRVRDLEARRRQLLRPGELALRYSEAGATGLNAFTFEDFTLYFVRLPPGKLELWFWLESDRLLDPVFRDFEQEKEVIRQEVGQRIGSTPTGRADDELRQAFWGPSPYAWRALGRLDDLARVERTEAEAFFERYYAPHRLTAVVVGPLGARRPELRQLARAYFGRLAARADDGSPERRRAAAPAVGGRVFETRCDCPRQAQVLYPTVPFRHPDSYRLQVLAGVLNGRTGRLYRSLVLERGIAFGASATQLSYRDAGAFLFAAETKGDAAPEELVAAWEREIERLRREPITARELRKVKNQLVASSLRGLRRPSDLARQLLVYAGLGAWRQIEDWPRRVAAVTAEEVRQAARRLSPESRLVAYYRRPEDPQRPPPEAPAAAAEGARPDVLTAPKRARQPHGEEGNGDGSAVGRMAAPAPPGDAVPASSSALPPAVEPAPHPGALVFDSDPFRPPRAERHRLAAGPSVYLAPDPSLPLVELSVALGAGSFLEPASQTGLAELAAALLRRGGAGERTADELDERLDLLGAELDTVGGEQRSGLRLSVPSWELGAALDVVFDVLGRPRLAADRLEVLRTNLVESMARRNQDPLAVLQREWGWLLFGDFYGSRQITPATLARVDREAIRAFHLSWWRPEHMVFALSGDFDTAAVVAELERRLAAWRARAPGPATEIPWPPPAPPGGAAPGLYLAPAETPQAKVLLGHRLESALSWTSPRRAAIEVLQEVLGGGGAVSRLGGRLRTSTGLVYRTWAHVEPGPETAGYFRVFFETDPEKAPRAIELALEEVERLRRDLVHPRELEIVRRTLADRIRGRFDTPEKIAGLSSEHELLGRPADYWQRHLDHLAAVSREDVRDAARAYLRPEEILVLVVGPEPAAEDARRLAAAAGHPVTRLPARDPSTLEPVSP